MTASKSRPDSRYLDLRLESTGEEPLFTQRLERYVFISDNPTQIFTTKMIGCRRCLSSESSCRVQLLFPLVIWFAN